MTGLTDGIGAQTAQLASLAQSSRLERVGDKADPAKAAKMFEDLLATTLVREMRRGLENGFFGEGPGSDVYEGWLDEHVGRSLSRSGMLDLAQAVRVSLGEREAATKEVKETSR